MAVIESTVFIERSPEDVFDYLVDLSNELEWNPGVESMEKLTPGPVGVGTRYMAKWKQSKRVEVECVSFNRPRGWTYVNGGPIAVTLAITLTPESGGTRLVARFDARPHGLIRLAFPIIRLVFQRMERTNMVNLKRALERQVPR